MSESSPEQLYREHVAEVEKQWRTVQAQKAIHEATVKAEYAKREPTIRGTTQEHVVDGRCGQDPIIRAAKSGIDRNLSFALMYGIGALLDRLPPTGRYDH
jgi:hypothetical protein